MNMMSKFIIKKQIELNASSGIKKKHAKSIFPKLGCHQTCLHQVALEKIPLDLMEVLFYTWLFTAISLDTVLVFSVFFVVLQDY